MLVSAIIIYLPPKENQLYFNLVLIYTDNKVKPKEGKRRNGFAIIFFLPAIITCNMNTFSLFEAIHYLEYYPYVKKEHFRGSILLILAE